MGVALTPLSIFDKIHQTNACMNGRGDRLAAAFERVYVWGVGQGAIFSGKRHVNNANLNCQ